MQTRSQPSWASNLLLKTAGHTLEPIGQGAKLIGPPRGADERIA
jgi:hypothetical protein